MRARDVALAVLAALIWGFNFIVIKFGLDAFPPLLFSALRFVSAAVPAVFLVSRKQLPWKLIVQVGVVLGFIKYALVYLGIAVGMPAGLSSLVLQAQVPFTLLLTAVVLGDKPSRLQRVGIGVAMGGIVLVAYGRAGGGNLAGLLLVVGGAVAWSFANVLIKRSGGVEPFRLMVWMSLVPPLPLLVISLLTEHPRVEMVTQMGWSGLGAVLYTGLIATVVAFGIWGGLLQTYSAGLVTPFALLVPVFGIAFSSLLLGEPLTLLNLLAGAVILLGLAIAVLGPRLEASMARREPQTDAAGPTLPA
jgi:O-acetylserine/cysteine efflux transporter